MVDDFTPEQNTPTPTRIYVNDTRIPASNVDVHLRKSGPFGINHYAEVEFPSPFDGVDYLDTFNGAEGNNSDQQQLDTLRIVAPEFTETISDDEYLLFNGFVTGIGNRQGKPERMWKCRARGIEHLAAQIPASVTWGEGTNEISAEYIGARVADEIESNTPFTVEFANDDDAEVNLADTDGNSLAATLSVAAGPLGVAIGKLFLIKTKKTFKPNRHTQADIVKWVEDKTATQSVIDPQQFGEGPQPDEQAFGFKGRMRFGIPTGNFSAHYLDGGNLKIIENNALAEMRPANTAVLKGAAKGSKGVLSQFNPTTSEDSYIKAKVRHTALYERAGGKELLIGGEQETDAVTEQEVITEAINRLKRGITGTSAGEMVTLFNAEVEPYDTITAKPTCAGTPATDTNALTYEVQRVHHKIRPSDEHKPRTIINVGPAVTGEDIDVVNTWKKDLTNN